MTTKKAAAAQAALMLAIAGFGETGGYVAKGTDELTALVTAQYVQTGPDGENGTIAVRATPAGMEAAKTAPAAAAPAADAPKPSFSVVTSVPLPSRTPGGGNKGKSIYPFDAMDVNASFFIPVTAKTPEPWKSLASTATSATRRYDELLKDANGAALMETVKVKGKEVTRQQRKHTRTFVMREVQDGTPWGPQFAGQKGAGVWRTA